MEHNITQWFSCFGIISMQIITYIRRNRQPLKILFSLAKLSFTFIILTVISVYPDRVSLKAYSSLLKVVYLHWNRTLWHDGHVETGQPAAVRSVTVREWDIGCPLITDLRASVTGPCAESPWNIFFQTELGMTGVITSISNAFFETKAIIWPVLHLFS